MKDLSYWKAREIDARKAFLRMFLCGSELGEHEYKRDFIQTMARSEILTREQREFGRAYLFACEKVDKLEKKAFQKGVNHGKSD